MLVARAFFRTEPLLRILHVVEQMVIVALVLVAIYWFTLA